ncbi:fused MFS/spermidine synthase [Rhodocyclus tenuis]|uniref:Spermidine synthase n=1 Tax=Rhodocyclus tenuis TaxID=1066 RepID=A0A840G551_RHOTE|nr:fused MFS/spermidine synthase [Rhodocyclus tenuis]MBB4247503.1 spermidine synthase [Rhodocyclus tenuis]
MSDQFYLAMLLAAAGRPNSDKQAVLSAEGAADPGEGMPENRHPECQAPAAGRSMPYVEEIGGFQSLHFSEGAVQSEMSLADPRLLLSDYTHAMMGFLLFKEAPEQIEMIGLGGGSLAKYCYHALPDTRITVAEISPEVIALRERFRIPADDERFTVLCADGADFIRQHEGRPDVLLVDGFDHQGQPPQLCSPGFYDYCYERLAPGGVMVVNLFGSDDKFGVFAARIRDSFLDKVVSIACEGGSNKVVFACKSEQFPPSRPQLLAKAQRCDAQHPFSMSSIAQRILHRLEQRKHPRAGYYDSY